MSYAWSDAVADYCERQDHSFWSEPLNAWTNIAFLVGAAAALALWRRQGRSDWAALALILVTASVGVGSFVFHTVATRGAELLDVIPIAIFIYGYFFLALRRFFHLGAAAAAAMTLAFAAGSYLVDSCVRGLNGSVSYLPPLGALVAFAALLGAREGWTPPGSRSPAAGFAAAALVFAISLSFRTIDRDICPLLPIGTHFLWHILNALALWLLLSTVMLARAPEAGSAKENAAPSP
jgi:hypothetical protein